MHTPPLRRRPSLAILATLALGGCWKLDAPDGTIDRLPFEPAGGAPEGWFIESFQTDLACPDGSLARFLVVYPEDVDQRVVEDAPRLPLVVLFHSGAFDYVDTPAPGAPLDGTSYQEDLAGEQRLTGDWSWRWALATLGLGVYRDPIELHTGALVAAFAEKGLTTLIPANCWGDWWHNRSTFEESQNLYSQGDYFLRDGRTLAEFAYRYATEEFPPGNPVELPVRVDTDRLFMVGLGEGSRAVGELLSLRDPDTGRPLYRSRAVVVDSPVDDLRVFFEDDPAFSDVKRGLNRIFRGGGEAVVGGSLAAVPPDAWPERFGLLTSAIDGRIPPGGNDLLVGRLQGQPREDVWYYEDTRPGHVLSNVDPTVAKGVADFLVEGLDAIDPLLDSPLPDPE